MCVCVCVWQRERGGRAGRDVRGAYVPLLHRYVGAPKQLAWGEVLAVLGPLLADEKVEKFGLDLKRVAVAVASGGATLEGFRGDAALASYLLDPEARHDRVALAERELGIRARGRSRT